MMLDGQLVQSTDTGKFAVYAGTYNSNKPGDFGYKVGYFTPELTFGGNYTHVEDAAGQVVCDGVCFSRRLTKRDRAEIQAICVRPAQPCRPMQPDDRDWNPQWDETGQPGYPKQVAQPV